MERLSLHNRRRQQSFPWFICPRGRVGARLTLPHPSEGTCASQSHFPCVTEEVRAGHFLHGLDSYKTAWKMPVPAKECFSVAEKLSRRVFLKVTEPLLLQGRATPRPVASFTLPSDH